MEKTYLALLNEYIAYNKSNTINQYRLTYHMSPMVGWSNDPNGLIYFKGAYHLYYQANPFRTKPGKMAWGHYISTDLVSFEDTGIALALDDFKENAYSGGAIEQDGVLNIFYTLHTEKHPELVRYDGEVLDGDEILTEEENEKRKHLPFVNEGKDVKEEEVYRSISIDGNYFPKGKLVFDNNELPSNISQTDFRDPCPVKIKDTYYLFVGGKDIKEEKGVIIVLKSKTLDHFKLAFILGPYYELGNMAECPCYYHIDNKDVLLVSGSNVIKRDNDFKNINVSVFIIGDLDFEQGTMKVDYIKEIDKGDSFYAPQFIRGANRPIMIGWLEMWGKKYVTRRLKHGYVGAFSIPRVISLHDGDIYQWPIEELDNYSRLVDYDYLPKSSDITLNMQESASIIIRGENGSVKISNEDGYIYVDDSGANAIYQSVRRTNGKYKNASLRILLDKSSIEVFVQNGKEAISDRIYIDGELKLETYGEVSEIKVKEIGDRR